MGKDITYPLKPFTREESDELQELLQAYAKAFPGDMTPGTILNRRGDRGLYRALKEAAGRRIVIQPVDPETVTLMTDLVYTFENAD